MWLLTTRNRPELCRRVLEACLVTGVSTPGLVLMDGCDYGELPLPDGWTAQAESRHRNIGALLREFLSSYPDLAWYGWIADDCLPKTLRWDRALVEAAGTKYIAYANDDWQKGVKERDGTPHVTSAVVMGGDFVRALGMLALPGQVQMYIDDVWESVAVPAGLMRYCPDVMVEHHHFANGKRMRDQTDTRAFNGEAFPMRDRALYLDWLGSAKHKAAMERAKAL